MKTGNPVFHTAARISEFGHRFLMSSNTAVTVSAVYVAMGKGSAYAITDNVNSQYTQRVLSQTHVSAIWSNAICQALQLTWISGKESHGIATLREEAAGRVHGMSVPKAMTLDVYLTLWLHQCLGRGEAGKMSQQPLSCRALTHLLPGQRPRQQERDDS